MSNSMPPAASYAALESQHRNGANWFYWIAVLSLITAVFQIAGGGLNFLVGLGVTLFVAAVAGAADQQVAPETAMVIKAIAIGVCGIVSAIFAGLGFFARRGHIWAYVVGMLLYALDGLIFVGLAFLDPGLWINAAFHGFVLLCLFNGCKAARALNSAIRETVEPDFGAGLEPGLEPLQ
ncbi:MAG TPA: hypothetical protein VMV10_05025 [Pirellulales bacterium]|nr:hypothetical protein [Pirellulales bacterium]